MNSRSYRKRSERGQVVVLFALLVPVILAIGSIVMSAGNWYVLKRHLQTQVDAAALAGGAVFTGCGQESRPTNTKIAQEALEYAGDTQRSAAPHNLQLEDAGDQRVVLNSAEYWSQGEPTDGSTLDNTIETPGTPCDTKSLDVKATDNEAPLLWKWIPLFPSPKARAKVEILKVQSTNGVKPLGVPEVDPLWVGVVFVDENGNPNLASSVRGKSLLDAQPTPPTGLEGMSVWLKDNISPVGINGNDRFSAVVVASRNPSASLNPPTLTQICAQVDTHCYAGEHAHEWGLVHPRVLDEPLMRAPRSSATSRLEADARTTCRGRTSTSMAAARSGSPRRSISARVRTTRETRRTIRLRQAFAQ